ncbi:MAG: hypothetical protein MJ228_05790 [Bacilli bacterium]|nr:hypothetical protein [Bacilli bacterium]
MKISFESFGFKYGLPDDGRMIIDVRHLPNPYWDEALRPFTGLDEPVAAYIRESEITKEFLKNLTAMLDQYFEESLKNGTESICVGIGCTGGQHRSVFVTETLYKEYKGKYNCTVSHRELSRYKRN